MGKVANKYGHVRRGMRPDLGQKFNSGWEADFARFLNLLQSNGIIEGWEYEPQRFFFHEGGWKTGAMNYLPDFVVRMPAGKSFTLAEETYQTNGVPREMWFEIKGREMSSDRTKWKRFKKMTGKDLYVIRREHIIDIRDRFSHLIPKWESWGTR